MKNIIFRIFLVVLIGSFISACSIFEEPNPFDESETPFVYMTFNGSDFNTVGMNAFETDSVTITVNLSNTEATSVQVNSRFRDVNGTTTKTLKTLTPVNQVVTFSMFVRNMGTSAGTPAGVSGFNSVPLDFVAIGGGKTTTRRFTITVARPFTIAASTTVASALSTTRAVNPVVASPNQVVSLNYSSAVTLTGQRIASVQIFQRTGVKGAETLISTVNYSNPAATVNQAVAYTVPPTAVIDTDTLYFRYLATYANGQTITINATSEKAPNNTPSTRIVANNLQDLRTAVVMTASGNSSSYDMATVTLNGSGTDNTVKDIILDSGGMSFRSGVGNNTDFVAAPSTFNFNGATLQSAETAYNAGVASTSVANILSSNIYICRIRARTGVDRYGVIRITAVTPNSNPTLSTITFDFRSLRP
jgi:hypothetical protein